MFRIISLDPAATEWVFAFGAGPWMVARSHACDRPQEVLDLPVVTASGPDGILVRVPYVMRLAPDVVLSLGAIPEAALEPLFEAHRGTILAFRPATFKQVLDAALHLGRFTGHGTEAMDVVAAGERRLQRLRDAVGLPRAPRPATLPTVGLLGDAEALPEWVCDVVDRAGGRPVVLADPEALERADPDVLALVGPDANPDGLRERPGWAELRAVQAGRVYAFGEAAGLLRPGPRLYRATELFALALYPDRVRGVVVPPGPGEMRRVANVPRDAESPS